MAVSVAASPLLHWAIAADTGKCVGLTAASGRDFVTTFDWVTGGINQTT